MVSQRKRHRSGAQLREWREGWLFAMPFIVGVAVFWVGPMLFSLFLVTQEWDLIGQAKFIGLDNFGQFFADPLALKSVWNTAYYTFLGVPIHLLVALTLAVALNQKLGGQAFYRTVFYLPAITPAVASAVVWMQLFNYDFGAFNSLLRMFGLPPVHWLFDPRVAKPAFILMGLWGVGPAMVIFLAGLQSVPVGLLEASEIDGAGAWAKFWRITVPIISPVVFFNLVMGIIGSFQVFTASFIMTGGGPQNATLFAVLYIYNNGFRYFRMGYATALAWILFCIIMVFVVLQFRLGRSWVYYDEGRI